MFMFCAPTSPPGRQNVAMQSQVGMAEGVVGLGRERIQARERGRERERERRE